MNIYDITEEYRIIQDAVENQDITEEEYEDMLSSMDMELENKAEGYCYVIENTRAFIKALKENEARFKTKRTSLEKRLGYLERTLLGALKATGKTDIRGKIFGISIGKNKPSVVVTDSEALMKPENRGYVRVKPAVKEPDKTAICAAIQSGEPISFARLEQKEKLRITLGR